MCSKTLVQIKALLPGSDQVHEGLRSGFGQFIKVYITSQNRSAELKKYLNLCSAQSESYPDEYNSSELLLEIVEKAMSFAVNAGLTYLEIQGFLSFYVCSMELLVKKKKKEKDVVLLTALTEFKDKVVPAYCSCFSHSKFPSILAFIKKTIFQHFHLYQFLLMEPQMIDATVMELDFEVPEKKVICLQEGTLEDVWIQLKRKQALNEEHEKKLKQLDGLFTVSKLQASEQLKKMYTVHLAMSSKKEAGEVKLRMSPVELSRIMNRLAEAYLREARVNVTQQLLKRELDLTLRLDTLDAMWAHYWQFKAPRTYSIRNKLAECRTDDY